MTAAEKQALIRRVAAGIGDLTAEKNAAYGDSFYVSGRILALLYPDGVQPEQYGDMLAVARIIDKLGRIATRKDAFGESPFKDIAGYGLIGVVADELAKGGGGTPPNAPPPPPSARAMGSEVRQ